MTIVADLSQYAKQLVQRVAAVLRKYCSNPHTLGLQHELIVRVSGEKDHLRVRADACYRTCRIETVHYRHRQIEHDQIGIQAHSHADSGLTVSGLTAYFPV